jgi:hypothetical protein
MTKLTIVSLFQFFFSTIIGAYDVHLGAFDGETQHFVLTIGAQDARILGALDERFAQKSEPQACSSSFLVINTKTNKLKPEFLPPIPPSSPNTQGIPDFHEVVSTKVVAIRHEWETEWIMELAVSLAIAQQENTRRMKNKLRKALL